MARPKRAKPRPTAKRTAKAPKPRVAVSSARTVEAFAGFDPMAMQFWHELAMEMNREWFTEHKARYDALWARPMQALLAAVAQRLARGYAPLTLASKVMRIHRDVRFSANKAPYKTHIGGVITVAGRSIGEGGNAALYVHLGLDEEFVGVGCYMFDATKLARWRKAVAGKPGAALAGLVTTLRASGYVVGGHDDYKRVPKPYAVDHPRAELLKQKGLTAAFPAMPRGTLHRPELVGWLAGHAEVVRPLVAWLHRHVG